LERGCCCALPAAWREQNPKAALISGARGGRGRALRLTGGTHVPHQSSGFAPRATRCRPVGLGSKLDPKFPNRIRGVHAFRVRSWIARGFGAPRSTTSPDTFGRSQGAAPHPACGRPLPGRGRGECRKPAQPASGRPQCRPPHPASGRPLPGRGRGECRKPAQPTCGRPLPETGRGQCGDPLTRPAADFSQKWRVVNAGNTPRRRPSPGRAKELASNNY
jgi:hypothetical protein